MINSDFGSVLAFIISLPPITAIIGCIITYIKIKNNNDINFKDFINKFIALRDEFSKLKKDNDGLKAQLQIVNQENIELKKDIKTLIRKIDRINRGDKNE